MLGHIVAKRDAQIKARTLPGKPTDFAAIDGLGRRLAAGRGRQRDHGVWMHMIDMGKGQIGMQRRVDRGRARIEIEGAVGKIAHHLIFELHAAIEFFQTEELVEIKGGKAVQLHRADIAARTLDPKNLDRLAGQGVLLIDLGRGVAAAEIGDSQIRAQQIRAIEEEGLWRQARRLGVRPAIGGDLERYGAAGHDLPWAYLGVDRNLRHPLAHFNHFR